MYAIVDIETTGSHPAGNGITEIAIILHNGETVEGKFSSLINPKTTIPSYIVSLTGITDYMVADAPHFSALAANIYNLLQGRIFVAHNVNFDYSFVKYHLQQAGYLLNTRKLCTIRMARKAFPGLRKYGLENLCRELEVPNNNHHRATGDALATAKIFEMILEKGGETLIKEFLKKENKDQTLPPNLPGKQIKELPYQPGVYYLHDAKGKVVYVGKAKNIKQRVVSHFTGLDTSKKRQAFLQQIHSVSYQTCDTEFTASLFESIEIKRLWPPYNSSQKRFEQRYGIYAFEDSKGLLRLAIDKKRKYLQPVGSYSYYVDAHRTLWKMVKQFDLHPVLCFLDKSGTTHQIEDVAAYNRQVNAAIAFIQAEKDTFLIKEKDTCILVEAGTFFGMGAYKGQVKSIDQIKNKLTPYPENEVIRSMIRSYVERYPANIQRFE
jgi:DNA polymerase-3 subunit epsilon